jgi:hypothetical protein
LPDAVILEGPKSGGHQGYKEDEIEKPEFQLEVTTLEVLDQIAKFKEFGDIPLFVHQYNQYLRSNLYLLYSVGIPQEVLLSIESGHQLF